MMKIFRPWVLVSLGIVFNIVSAVITHYFIDMNNQSIRHIESGISNIDQLIESQWRSKTQLDRKEEFLLSMLNTVKINKLSQAKEVNTLIHKELTGLIKQHNILLAKPLTTPIADFGTIINIATQSKLKIINSINNTYLERLELDEQRHPIREDNALLSTLAIFLQVSGLILVLSKDINS